MGQAGLVEESETLARLDERRIRPPEKLRLGGVAKRSFDVAFAAVGLTLLCPLFLLIMILIRADGSPALFSQIRVGRRGVPFPCFKFRTMYPDAEARLKVLLRENTALRGEWERTQKLRDDPRVTPIGRFLRTTSLDELPQLLNVLRGEMSLVGPRPVLESELAEHYGASRDIYEAVLPGITGLWQTSGRSSLAYEERVKLDIAYVAQQSFLGDLIILLKTPWVVFGRKGAC